MFRSLPQVSSLAICGSAATATVLYAWRWFNKDRSSNLEPIDSTEFETGNATIEGGRDHLLRSCALWEAELKAAILAEDLAAAQQLRKVLRSAYETLEQVDSSFKKGDSVARRERLRLERVIFGHDSCDRHGDNESDAMSFISAGSRVADEQDLSGFETKLSKSPPRSCSRSRLLSSTDMWALAMIEARAGRVPIRKVRLKYTGCKDDEDFAARVFCFRKGMDVVFKDEENRRQIRETFMHVLSGIIIKAGDDPKSFVSAVDRFGDFLQSEYVRDELKTVGDELINRGMKVMNFYDIVLDYLLFDAWDLVASPPPSVKAALQSSWVPQVVRVRTIRSTVWGITRTRLSLFKSGTFMKNYYTCMLGLVPPFAVGLLEIGDQGLIDVNKRFQEIFIELIVDIFAIPGSVPNLTADGYAEKIMENFRRWIPRANHLVSQALDQDVPKM